MLTLFPYLMIKMLDWRQVFKIVQDILGVEPVELIKLGKCCVLFLMIKLVQRGALQTLKGLLWTVRLWVTGVLKVRFEDSLRSCAAELCREILISARLSNDLKQAHILKMQEEREEKRKGLRKIIKLLKLKLLLK